MPPKKPAKDEEIDLSTLPPWLHIIVCLSLQMKKGRALSFMEKLKTAPKSFQKNITRDDIVSYAKEKGLYVDLAALSDKQKKDNKYMESIIGITELNAKVLAKAFAAMIHELDIQGRRTKKDKLEGKEVVVDKKTNIPAQKDQKKEAGKGGKKDGAPEEKKEEIAHPEKEYNKAFDIIYILYDYPKSEDELIELSHIGLPPSLLLSATQKILFPDPDPDMLNADHPDYENSLKKRMEDFIDRGGREEGEEEGEEGEEGGMEGEKIIDYEKQEELNEEDRRFIEEGVNLVNSLRRVRKKVEMGGKVRNCYIMENVMEVDPSNEGEYLNSYMEMFFEDLAAFSFDIGSFEEWTKSKRAISLFPSVREQERKKREEEALHEDIHVPAPEHHEEGKKPEEKDKKGSQPAAPPKHKEKEKEKKELAPSKKEEKTAALPGSPPPPAEEEKKKEVKKEIINNLFYYEKQLNNIDNHVFSPGLMLECLIDQLDYERSVGLKENTFLQKENENDIREINKHIQMMSEKIFLGVEAQPLKKELVLPEMKDNDKKTLFKSIIDEADEIETRTQNIKFNNLDEITIREKQLLAKLNFPGIARYMMPDVPEKSENIRKAEKCQFYPFITCDISEFERERSLIKFETLLSEIEPDRKWDLSYRIYTERHDKNTLSQTFFKALLLDPSVFVKYNESDDNLYVILYFKNPSGRILRKKWTSDWKVIPNLENFILYFKNNENNLKNEIFYDLDYEQIGNIYERTKYAYPNDNGILVCTKYKISDTLVIRYRVIKETYSFNIRPSVIYPNFTEISVNFENQTRLLVEIENNGNSADEIKAAGTLSLPNGLTVKFLSNGDISQTLLRSNKLENKRNFEDIVSPYDDRSEFSDAESSRVITGKGSVIKYMKDGSIIILYANGNVAVNKRNGLWTTTNNKGLRRVKRIKDGHEHETDPIPCANRTDPETGCNMKNLINFILKGKILIREDKVIVITYKDGSLYTQHKDGTKMYTSSDGQIVLVESEKYATIKVRLDEVKARMKTVIGLGSAFAAVGFTDIMERSHNGRVTETYLPDNTKVFGFKEKRELQGYNNFVENTIHLIYLEDGTTVKLNDNGEIIMIGAVDRLGLNEDAHKEGEDKEYFLQLFGIPEERKTGVYTADITKNLFWTQDNEGNKFTVYSNGEVDAKIAVSLNIKPNIDRPQTPEFDDGEFIEEENKFLPQPENWVPPRLFVVNNDDTGYEFLTTDQLQSYFNNKDKDSNCSKIVEQTVPGISNAQSLSFLTKHIPINKRRKNLISVNIPRNIDMLPQTIKKNEIPDQDTFLYRNLLVFKAFNESERERFKNDMEKYEVWKKNELKEISEFGIIQKSEEERDKEFNIQLKIMEHRNKNSHMESFVEAKSKIEESIRNKLNLSQNLQKETKDVVREGGKRTSMAKKKKKAENKNSISPIKREDEQAEKKNESSFENVPTQKTIPTQKTAEYPGEKKQNERKYESFCPNYFLTLQGQQVPKEINPKLSESKVRHKDMEEEVENLKKTLTEMGKEEMRMNENASQNPIQIVESPAQRTAAPAIPLPSQSIFARIDAEMLEKDLMSKSKAKLYHSLKTKTFDVYGEKREKSPQVPCLLRSTPEAKLNQKYILVESGTDKRLKVSSLSNRIYLKATAVNDMRNQGIHEVMMKSLDKKNKVSEILERKNLMIMSEVNDKLKKDLLILPGAVEFGNLQVGKCFETCLTVVNEDIMAQRITVKLKKFSKNIRIYSKEAGPIAPGLSKKIFIQINAMMEIIGDYSTSFRIISKNQKYRIPVKARILNEEGFMELEEENRREKKGPVLKPKVYEFYSAKKEKISNYNDRQEFEESHGSDLFPRIDKGSRRNFAE